MELRSKINDKKRDGKFNQIINAKTAKAALEDFDGDDGSGCRDRGDHETTGSFKGARNMSDSLMNIFAREEFESNEDEILELKHKGKMVKFIVISREWNDEKVGFDLTLITLAGKNWRYAAKQYRAFQNATDKAEINFIKETI